jgi:hypothetical protein
MVTVIFNILKYATFRPKYSGAIKHHVGVPEWLKSNVFKAIYHRKKIFSSILPYVKILEKRDGIVIILK